MHMLERFQFGIVHSNGDFKRVFLDGAGDNVSNKPERGKRLFTNGQLP